MGRDLAKNLGRMCEMSRVGLAAAVLALGCCAVSCGVARARDLDEILRDSGLPGGLVVCVGGGVGSLEKLDSDGKFVVQVLDTDPAKVQRMRESLQAKGLHGTVTAAQFDGKRLPYIDNLVNVLIVDGDAKVGAKVAESEIWRVVAPRGVVLADGKKEVKPWPEELDGWPHWLYGPENNAVSRDTKVGISRNLQWVMPPAWGRHHNLLHSINAMVSDGGRIYYIMDEAPIGANGPTSQWTLGCRDAFNGFDLWRRPIDNWGWHKWSAVEISGTMRFRGPDQIFRRLVADGDTVYATLGFNEPVSALDGKTGKNLKVYEGTEETATIQIKDGTLYLTKNVLGEAPGKTLMAVDAASGRVLWERKGFRGITPQGTEMKKFTDAHLTIGEKHVFCLDGDDIVGLSRKTGENVWRIPRPTSKDGVFGHYNFNFRHFCTLVYHDGMLFLGQIAPDPRNLNSWQLKDMAILALDPATGEKRWEHVGMSLAHFTPPDLFVTNGLVWTMKKDPVSVIGLDMKTGKVEKEYPAKDMLVGHHHRCYRNKASANYYLAGEEGIEYINFATGELDVHHWIRGACAYGIMPANGLIYLPAHACGCHGNAKLNGFLALANRDGALKATPPEERLEKGAGYTATAKLESTTSPESWPVYKHDNLRSNATASVVPPDLTKRWSVSLGTPLTAPTIADGSVFVAASDAHEVCSLDAGTGKVRWRFAADGRIDSPPTYYGGRLFFGTRCGSVYSLTGDGELVWRFQAAPAQQNLAAYGQLESVWPVNGSVLVQSGKVYCTAGRSMNLDSGVFAYVLDAASGKVLQQTQLQADTKPKGETGGSVLAGLLVGDDEGVFMRNMRFDPDDIAKYGVQSSRDILTPNCGGLLDPSWYNSAFWKYGGLAAQMVVFDDRYAVGVAAYKKQVAKSYPHDVFKVGSGYQVVAVDLAAKGTPPAERKPAPKGKGKKKSAKKPAAKRAWQTTIPVRAEAIVLTGDAVCLAGPPDVAEEKDPWGAFENRKGGRLMLLSKSTGEKIGEHPLESAPVYDGMAVADGCVFLALKNGELICLGAK